MLAVKRYSIKRATEYKIVESDQLRYNAQCIQFEPDCNWSILISYCRKQEKWEFRRYTGLYTCMQTSMGDKTIMYLPAMYNKLTENLSLGTWVQLVTHPCPGSADTVMFHRIFWTFPPCVEAFRHCKPLISIDGTHLNGKYDGTLLIAIAQDGNANILPIVFVVVEGETKEAWSFFLSYLRQHVTPQPEVLVISNKYKSIDGVLNAEGSLRKPPHAFQAFCTRHIIANFMTHFENKDLKKVLINTVYSKSQREFTHYFGRLRGKNVAITNWLEEMPRSQ
ncbi:uncharacterized protein LOC130974831 [Arachis stenosperma]|uniref:uncharacterized protein LOC130974831 n=1 Tax=Arachis stenosperma TaxID=217475 RepID=UPI0025AD77DD|nr:uncharacterized protein LOC130974831 [Arachis stenosperma]